MDGHSQFEEVDGHLLLREPVMGWVVVESPRDDHEEDVDDSRRDGRERRDIWLEPLVAPVTMDGETPMHETMVPELYAGDQILGLIPDLFGTMRVSVVLPDEADDTEYIDVLGYDYQGATNPDWGELAGELA